MSLIKQYERSNVTNLFPKTRAPLPSTQVMDDLKVAVMNVKKNSRVLAQELSDQNKKHKSKDLFQLVSSADKIFDVSRNLEKELNKFKSTFSISKRDFKNKLEDKFRDLFAFLDAVELDINKQNDIDLKKAKNFLFLVKKEANTILKNLKVLVSRVKASRV